MFGHIKRHRDPVLRYDSRYRCFTRYDSEARKSDAIANEAMIVDFGTVRHGWERLVAGKKHNLVLAYINEDMPTQPDAEHLSVGVVRVIMASLGRGEIIVDNNALADAFTDLHSVYTEADEAKQGMMPVVSMKDGDLAFEITEWLARDEQFFGKRTIPMP